MSNNRGLSDSEDDYDMDGIQDTPTPETLKEIASLKENLSKNPNQYELHTQLIALLKTTDMLGALRDARERMSAVFPLSEDLWMSWIQDESNMATSKKEKQHILVLYERAISDYLSINIWSSYVEYALREYMESVEFPSNEAVVSKESLRAIFNKANKFTGYHVTHSHIIWNIWMDFELEQLALMNPPGFREIDEVKEMYLERIAVPHSDLENTFSGLSSFVSKHYNENYEESMAKYNKIRGITRKEMLKLEPFEDQLVASGNSWETFAAYLEYEVKTNPEEFMRTRTLFERAVTVHCLSHVAWNYYLSFLLVSDRQKQNHDLTPKEMLSVAIRSVRNCPWSGDLWENRLLLLETYGNPAEEYEEAYNSAANEPALLANAQELCKVLLARCSYNFRKTKKAEAMDEGHVEVRTAFKEALATMEAAGGDPYFRVERFWIELETNQLGDIIQARKLCKSIESKLKTSSEFWLSQVEMERTMKNNVGIRQVFTRACLNAHTMDWPERVMDAWLLFERQFGTLKTYKQALMRSRTAMRAVEAVRAQNAYAAQVIYGATQPATDIAYAPDAAPAPVAASATDIVSSTAYGDAEKELSRDASKKRKLSIQGGDQAAKITKTEGDEKDKPKPLSIGAGRHEDTCFVTNFTREMTEKALKEMFEEYGEVLRCTIPTTQEGKKRQFAYVQFSTSEEAHAALALDGRDVGDRRGLSVKISDTTQKKLRDTTKAPLPLVSRYEVHISGLSNEIKDEELRKLVALHAEPTHVYISRSNADKGGVWANIKFKTEEDAKTTLALNGTMFQGKRLITTERVFRREEMEVVGDHKVGRSRTERRKLNRQAREEAGLDESAAKAASSSVLASNSTGTATALSLTAQDQAEEEEQTKEKGEQTEHKAVEGKSIKAGEEGKKHDAGESTSSALSETKQPAAPKTMPMVPRSMMPRQANPQARMLKSRVSHAHKPIDVFKSATTQAGFSATTSATSEAAKNEAGDSEAPAVAPKSNADFRALMLSGALKKHA